MFNIIFSAFIIKLNYVFVNKNNYVNNNCVTDKSNILKSKK